MPMLTNGSGGIDAIFQVEIFHFMSNEVINISIFNKYRHDLDFTDEKSGARIIEKISSFDTFIQVMEGLAHIVTDKTSYRLEAGEYVIIPANTFYKEKGNEAFKMTVMRIMNGYNIE